MEQKTSWFEKLAVIGAIQCLSSKHLPVDKELDVEVGNLTDEAAQGK